MENKQLDSYENIYDKLNTENAKKWIIDNLNKIKFIFDIEFLDFEDESNKYLTSNISSFKSIISAYKKQDDKKIPFDIFNPIILWEELTNVQSEISREHYKEILDILDENFITEQLNKPSISLTTFKDLLENYKDLFSNKINIKTLESDEMKSLVQIPKKRPKRKLDNRNDKRNALIKYINQYSKIADIDEKVINQYKVRDLLSIKDSIYNKKLYIEILKERKRSVKNGKNSKNAIDKLIAEIGTENELPSTM